MKDRLAVMRLKHGSAVTILKTQLEMLANNSELEQRLERVTERLDGMKVVS